MELDVKERLVALNLLPREGTFINLKLIRKAREELSFNEKENKALNFRQKGDQITWDQKINISKKIDLGEVVSLMLIDILGKFDKDGKLREEHFSLYEKMVEKDIFAQKRLIH